jgi:zinc transport system substrate-binding protein
MNRNKSAVILTVGLLCMLPVLGFAADEGTITVFTSILPQEYFVERIGGDRVEVQALVAPGRSPATYEPTPRQMASLSEAKIFFRIGVPFENAFMPKIQDLTQGLRIVDTREGITLREMKAHHHGDDGYQHEDHHADEEHHHHHGGTDPHVWLSPRLVKIQARTIADALIDIDPAGRAIYEKNLAAFVADLDVLDAHLAEALAPVKGKTFMVFHPAWGYFADAYGLEQTPIEIEGKDPSGQQLVRVIEMAKEQGVRVIFVQPQFSRQSAERVAGAIDGAVLPIDPLARDYVGNLERVATEIREALQNQT